MRKTGQFDPWFLSIILNNTDLEKGNGHLSELRWDPLKDNWTILTQGHSRRPQDFILRETEIKSSSCSLCGGRENLTSPELYAYRPSGSAPNQPGWLVRVVPNRAPVLRIEGGLDSQAVGLYDRMGGIGAHEVIIETPEHNKQMADLSVEHLAEVLKAYRVRMLDLRNDSRFRYLFVFKNFGREASAKLDHSHSQLIAVPLLPPLLTQEIKASRDHFYRKERCLICDLLRQERTNKERVVYDDGKLLVYAPYASRFPFELMLAPIAHQHDFCSLSDLQLLQLATVLKSTLLRLRQALRDPAYSFSLHTSPPVHQSWGRADELSNIAHYYHWHIEIHPKLTQKAGFEWGSGFHINPTAPEEAAAYLRKANIRED
jgi:UDPglucose--hexose-1-phosphate uridylyltransferase